jgi:hypothetical protein
MDPLTLVSDPLPGLVLLVLSFVWLANRRSRTRALVGLLAGATSADAGLDLNGSF